MSSKECDFARSEITTLEGLLNGMPEDRLIERIGIEERLKQARERLAELESSPLAQSLPITFRGAPVEGVRSIDAVFASTALKAFIEATDTVAASLTSDGLKGRGRLPGASRSLRIVDTARGSFGFELELPPPVGNTAQMPLEGLGEEPDPYASAIATTFKLIADATSSDEEGVSDLIAEIHPRAATKVHAFAKVLSDAGAGFAAEFEGRRVRLNEGAEVQRVLDALRDEDIAERTDEQNGVLLGILPESRRFECRITDGRVIAGKVDRALPDIARFKATWENKEALLSFRVVSVRTNQRFILTAAGEPRQ
jgi:hypothetical protein